MKHTHTQIYIYIYLLIYDTILLAKFSPVHTRRVIPRQKCSKNAYGLEMSRVGSEICVGPVMSDPPLKFPLFDLEVASNACATGVRFSDIVIGACLVLAAWCVCVCVYVRACVGVYVCVCACFSFSMAERSYATYGIV